MSRIIIHSVLSLPGISGALLGFFMTRIAHAHEINMNTSCEIRLLNPSRAPDIFKWFQSGLDNLRENREARTDPYALGAAIEQFGLYYPTENVRLRLEKTFGSGYILAVDDTDHAFAAMLKVPPLLIWKQFSDADENVMSIPSTVPDWGPFNFRFGTIMENEGEARKFISIEKVGGKEFVVTLGIDVICDEVRRYTRNNHRQYILFTDGTYLCRVPVIVSLPLVN